MRELEEAGELEGDGVDCDDEDKSEGETTIAPVIGGVDEAGEPLWTWDEGGSSPEMLILSAK